MTYLLYPSSPLRTRNPDEQFADEVEAVRAAGFGCALQVYAEKRAAILRGFLERERIFSTPFFFERYEGQARKNIAQSISVLSRDF